MQTVMGNLLSVIKIVYIYILYCYCKNDARTAPAVYTHTYIYTQLVQSLYLLPYGIKYDSIISILYARIG